MKMHERFILPISFAAMSVYAFTHLPQGEQHIEACVAAYILLLITFASVFIKTK